jgi:hypothetical protein
MTDWKPIANPALRGAIERYRRETGRDPRDDHPDLDGDEGRLGVYLIMMGHPPREDGTVLPFRTDPKENTQP